MFRATGNITKSFNRASFRRISTASRSPSIRYGLICSAGLAFTVAVTTSKLSLESQQVPEEALSEANPAKARYVAFDEVQKHTTPESCWVIIEGQVYDVTDFLEAHPGGAKVILRNSGKDATTLYAPIHPKGTIENNLPPECHLGAVDPTTLPDIQEEESDEQRRVRTARENIPPLGAMVSLEDFEKLATDILPNTAYAYYSSAGDDEDTLRENINAWKKYWFRPRVLNDITKIDLSTTIMGIKSALPIFISPAAMARLGHPLGEINLTKGAAQTGIIQGISSNASCTLEEMCEARDAGQPLIFQLYLNWDRKKSEEIVRKVEELKINGIMFTVDAPVPGKRERDLRAKGDFDDDEGGTKGVAQAISGYQAADLSWKDVDWLKSITDLPLIIKGVQSVEDAKLAAESGVKGIVLSNHGGRQLNFAPASIDVLREIREEAPEVFEKLEVYVDGGAGQAGNQVSKNFWETLLIEHGLTNDGYVKPDTSDMQLERLNVYFNEINYQDKARYVPRSINVDLEPNTMEVLRQSKIGSLFSPSSFINGQSGAGNNFGKGYYTEGAELVDTILDSARREAEQVDSLQGFQLNHSLGGGTGSGLGTLLMSKLREEFPDRMMATFSIIPSPKVSDTVVEPYNAVLATNQLIENSDLTFMLDNEALYRICQNTLKSESPNYDSLNSLISRAMAGVSTSLRFPSQLNSDLRKLAVNMIPFPRLHFLCTSVAPLTSLQNRSYQSTNVQDLTASLFNNANMLAQLPKYGRYMTAAALYQGPMGMRDIEDSIMGYQSKNSDEFVEWIPHNVLTSHTSVSPIDSKTGGTFIANTTAVQELFNRNASMFSAMLKRRAYLHWYTGEGMDEMEFTEAESNLMDLIAEYQQYENAGADEEEYGEEEYYEEEAVEIQDLDVGLLDRIVAAFFAGAGQERVLTQFQEHPDSWQRVPAILEMSPNPQTKYIGLQILEKLIQTKWKVLPVDQQQGIRNFIVNAVIKTSEDEAVMRREKTYLNKLNLILVQILKQAWPRDWPSFIPEIVTSSKTNLSLCENNMIILKLLSEEIFDYSAEQMTQAKTKALKNSMCGEFSEIFQLCSEVLEKAVKPSLIKATLDTLLKFLNWIPLGYIFETNIIDMLISRFLEVPEFRNVTLKCLAEISSLKVTPEYDAKFVLLFNMVMTIVNKMIPPSTDIAGAYESSNDSDQELILNLALFLTNFLGSHLSLVETPENKDVLLNAHLYLVKISQVPEREIFKICLEYWSVLVAELYDEVQHTPMAEMNPLLGLNMNVAGASGGQNLRKNIYNEVLSNLRLVMIERMVKPEEVLIVENDEGEIVREFLKESDTIVLYKDMRGVLVYLTHLDVYDTETIMTEKLAKQVDGSEWSWSNLNTLCWAIGSISGAMNEDTEKRFLVTVIKDLLGLCEIKRGKDNKAVVASDIMYIVGQYPRFLKAHWKFLKTVVNKLFEFMHETHEGVQDMACDTFIKIAQKCRRHFVMQQSAEQEPFIDEILRNLHRITIDLAPQQVHTFYEAVGSMIAVQPNKPVQENLIAKLMDLPNNAWDTLMQQAASNVDVLSVPENIKILSNVLKTNVSACSSIGSFYLPQIGRIYMDMLGLYKAVSGVISETVAAEGNIATRTPKVRGLRTIKKEVLRLVETYIKKAEDLETVNANFIPPLFEAILLDYNRNVPSARDAEVLNVTATIVNKLGPLLTEQIPPILDAIFECTLSMINQDFAEFPEHRVGFFKLLRAINYHCFPALLQLPPSQFKLTMDSVVWAIKHTMRDIADTGLNLALEVIDNIVKTDTSVANAFFQTYYLSLLQDSFYVLTDSDHKSGFKLQSVLLARLYALVSKVGISAPLYDPAQVDPSTSNVIFVRDYTANLLANAFPHLQPVQIQSFVTGLFELHEDPARFKLHLRDFLIQLKELQGDHAGAPAIEQANAPGAAAIEFEQQEEERKQREAARNAVPGMIKPALLEDEEL
ncbi:hypothetical protein E3Q02_03491 [Wallemia mellicola]|uniref:Importin N-terminal domain-containing protein n=1 Tax=Wallemia mellicola TaxID=1708541 RepID=A0AB38MQX2_9BASI|nr:hypothetical protein E3Q09_03456 [Wallemia mellicola]TIC62412.1 hypothetical protein E3Q02_03491 [Wallemia mellicola]